MKIAKLTYLHESSLSIDRRVNAGARIDDFLSVESVIGDTINAFFPSMNQRGARRRGQSVTKMSRTAEVLKSKS